MKKTKLLFVTVFSLLLTCSVSAQSNRHGWYLSAGGGTQLLFSSDAENLDFGQRLTPSISLAAGKWITPIWGLRLQAGAYSLNGYSTTNGIYLADPLENGLVYGSNDPVREEVSIRPDGSYRHYLRYANIHADLQLSLFNLFGKRKYHKWDIIPSVGLGYFQTFEYKGTPSVSSISSNFSLMGKYAVCKNLDVNLEVSTVVLPDAFDGRISGKTYENTLGATLGLTYHFKGKPRLQKGERIIRHDTIIKEIRDTVEVEKIVEKRITVTENAVREPFRIASIRFNLAGLKPLTGQEVQFVNIANYLENNPKSNLLLEGYGDKETGSVEENLRVSAVRAENVRKVLIDKYNIKESRIKVKAIGSQEQLYNKNAWNRVVVVKVVE